MAHSSNKQARPQRTQADADPTDFYGRLDEQTGQAALTAYRQANGRNSVPPSITPNHPFLSPAQTVPLPKPGRQTLKKQEVLSTERAIVLGANAREAHRKAGLSGFVFSPYRQNTTGLPRTQEAELAGHAVLPSISERMFSQVVKDDHTPIISTRRDYIWPSHLRSPGSGIPFSPAADNVHALFRQKKDARARRERQKATTAKHVNAMTIEELLAATSQSGMRLLAAAPAAAAAAPALALQPGGSTQGHSSSRPNTPFPSRVTKPGKGGGAQRRPHKEPSEANIPAHPPC